MSRKSWAFILPFFSTGEVKNSFPDRQTLSSKLTIERANSGFI